MAAGRSALVWILLLVGVGAGGIYLADRLVLAPGRQMERALADRDAQIRVLREHAQALEAAIRLLRHTERRARLEVLDQAPGPDGHLLTRLRFSEIDSRGEPIGEAREISVSGDEVYVDTLVIKFEGSFVSAGDALKGRSPPPHRRPCPGQGRADTPSICCREGAEPVRAGGLGATLGAGR